VKLWPAARVKYQENVDSDIPTRAAASAIRTERPLLLKM
jgi:hypothetical protein